MHIHYGGIEAVKGIDLTVEEGEIVTLIGGNGAGKTTTLKTISGIKHPTTGDRVPGASRSTACRRTKIMSLGIAHAPEGRRIFGRMTVRENLEMGLYASPTGTGGKSPQGGRGTRSRVRAVPGPQAALLAARRNALGGRAADAGDRPGADDPTRTC